MTGSEAVSRKRPGDKGIDVVARMAGKFDKALDELAKAKRFAKSAYQTDVFQIAEALMTADESGMRELYQRAHRFDEVGVFDGGPWVDPAKLQPPLVAGSLKAGGVYPVVETLSELRMLAIAKGKAESAVDAQEATAFLNEVMALNLEFIFPRHTEEERIAGGPHRDASIRLFALLAEELELSSLLGDVVSEIEQICAQRPIMTSQVRRMIDMAARIPPRSDASEVDDHLHRYARAINGPSPLSQEHGELPAYREALKELDDEALEKEAHAFAESMDATGLCSVHQAVLLRHLRRQKPDLIPTAMALNELGRAEFAQNREFALQLIRVCVLPATAQSIYGFAKTLEYGLLSRQEVAAGLKRLIELDLQSDVRRNLLARRNARDGATANSILVSGMVSVFGQPLGVGQGHNPTCQAARAISLWSQHAQGYLLEVVVSAARDGFVEIPFEGERLRSNQLFGGLAPKLDYELDPVSVVLVPHLDRVYDEMMRRVALRDEDGHKWVNPALYGRWVPSGFASIFADRAQTLVADYDEFIRRFFATHHPAYNDGHTLMYPNPVGILVTNSHGDYLGPHAVSLQRVTQGPDGTLRAYFYNPNNEGRQDWGRGVKPSIWGHGEEEGESSLPFHDFASRLYAFHYNPYEEGDAYAVPARAIQEIESASRDTWGKAFAWR
jgi:hypothetical protein